MKFGKLVSAAAFILAFVDFMRAITIIFTSLLDCKINYIQLVATASGILCCIMHKRWTLGSIFIKHMPIFNNLRFIMEIVGTGTCATHNITPWIQKLQPLANKIQQQRQSRLGPLQPRQQLCCSGQPVQKLQPMKTENYVDQA